MKTLIKAVVAAVVCALLTVSPAFAGPATDSLNACLTKNMTGKDRTNMARWIFAAMASNPEIQDLSNVSQENREELNKIVGAIFMRLTTDNCAAQARLAHEAEGINAFQTSFATLAKLAATELMMNPRVLLSLLEIVRHIDKDHLWSELSEE